MSAPEPGNVTNGVHSPAVVGLVSAFVAVVVIVGSVGNFLTFYTIVLVKRLRTTSFALVANLALTDMCIALFAIPVGLSRFLFSELYQDSGTACQAPVYLTLTLVTVSFNTLQVIAANRYFIITKPRHVYFKYWNRLNTGFIIAFIWLYSLFLAGLPLFGFGEIDYIPQLHSCGIVESNPISWWCKTILLLNVVESCGIVTPIFFLLTFKKIRSTKYRLHCSRSLAIQFNTGVRPQGYSEEEISVTKMTAAVFFCFLLCWFPNFIFHIATIGKVKQIGIVTFLVILAESSSALNCFIYAGMNTKIRKAVCLLLGFPARSSAVNSVS